MEKRFEIGDMVFQIMEEIKPSKIKSCASVLNSRGIKDNFVLDLTGVRNFDQYGIIKTSDGKYIHVRTDYIGYVQKKLTPEEYLKQCETKMDRHYIPEESYLIKFEVRTQHEQDPYYDTFKKDYEKVWSGERLIPISEGVLITDSKKLAAEILSDFKPASSTTQDIQWVGANDLFGRDVYPTITIDDNF